MWDTAWLIRFGFFCSPTKKPFIIVSWKTFNSTKKRNNPWKTFRELAVSGREELDLLAERESVYRLLAQVTKDNMHKNVTKVSFEL